MYLELTWKINRLKRWWTNQSFADRLFLYMNCLFVFMVIGVPLLCMLFNIPLD